MITIKDVQRILIPIKHKIFSMIARGIVESIDDSKKTQTIKVVSLNDNSYEDIEKLSEFGFTSVAPQDGNTETILFAVEGTKDILISLCCHNRESRQKNLNEGESVMYGKDSAGGFTNQIKISPTKDAITISNKDGITIEVKTDGTKQVNITGADQINLLAATEAFIKGNAFQTLYNAHTHPTAAVGPPSPPTVPMGAAQLSTKIKGE